MPAAHEAKVALGPDDGAEKLTEVPDTAFPYWSVTATRSGLE